MRSVFDRVGELLVVGVLLVLLAPAAAHALQGLLLPLGVFIGLGCLIRLIWFYTQL